MANYFQLYKNGSEMAPNKDNLRKLVRAIRSGMYKQGRGFLRRFDRFCCLGVGCDVYKSETGKGEWCHDDRFHTHENDESFGSILPVSVAKFYGVESDPIIRPGVNLSYINDNGNLFETIANIIEVRYGLLKKGK